MRNFIKDCLRTEAKPTANPMRIDSRVYADLIHTIQDIIEMTKYLDNLKKVIFYGKEPENKSMVKSVVTASKYRMLHAAIGVVTEGGELLEALIDNLQKDDVDEVNLIEEGGDVMWYLSILFDELDTDFEKAGNTVINKLKVRYPEKFTSDEALQRDLLTERETLEHSVK